MLEIKWATTQTQYLCLAYWKFFPSAKLAQGTKSNSDVANLQRQHVWCTQNIVWPEQRVLWIWCQHLNFGRLLKKWLLRPSWESRCGFSEWWLSPGHNWMSRAATVHRPGQVDCVTCPALGHIRVCNLCGNSLKQIYLQFGGVRPRTQQVMCPAGERTGFEVEKQKRQV